MKIEELFLSTLASFNQHKGGSAIAQVPLQMAVTVKNLLVLSWSPNIHKWISAPMEQWYKTAMHKDVKSVLSFVFLSICSSSSLHGGIKVALVAPCANILSSQATSAKLHNIALEPIIPLFLEIA